MGLSYHAVGWNRQKKIYDGILWGGILLYLVLYAGSGALLRPNATVETLLIGALGTSALLLLHVILCIGPLCRLDARFLPLLYNRRHMGVTMFTLALAHGAFAIIQFHTLGDTNPLISVLTANPRYDSVSQFPFESLGLFALVILFFMAATSHDFWLANLTAPVWKALHMMVYVAYALLVMHVVLGVLQEETSSVFAVLVGAGIVAVVGLHLTAGVRERRIDRPFEADDGMLTLCPYQTIEEGRSRVFHIGGERVAVFRYDSKISAVSSVCQHQNGPLGEGRVIDGFITCPWHGYQYCPDTGASPPPYDEKIPTFNVNVVGDQVLLDPRPNPPGTRVEPAVIPAKPGAL